MRIVERKSVEWEVTETCDRCETTVAFGVNDLRFSSSQLEGELACWVCPVCKREHWFDAHRVPKYVRALAGRG